MYRPISCPQIYIFYCDSLMFNSLNTYLYIYYINHDKYLTVLCPYTYSLETESNLSEIPNLEM